MKSRNKAAQFAADALLQQSIPRDELIMMLAAWLKDSKNSRQSNYLIQDIAKKLADSGYVYITVKSAYPLTDASRDAIVDFVQQQFTAKFTVEIDEIIVPKLIGGVQIDTPIGSLDATVKRKLIQIIKGVQR